MASTLLRVYKNQSLEYIRIDTSRCGSGKFFPVELMYADYQENNEFKELVCIQFKYRIDVNIWETLFQEGVKNGNITNLDHQLERIFYPSIEDNN